LRPPLPSLRAKRGNQAVVHSVSFGVIFNFHGITPYFSNLLVAMTVTTVTTTPFSQITRNYQSTCLTASIVTFRRLNVRALFKLSPTWKLFIFYRKVFLITFFIKQAQICA
jgi:hypothetical protein